MAFRDAVFEDHHKMKSGENGCLEYTDAGVGSNLLALSQLVRGGKPKGLVRQILSEKSTRDIEQLVVLTFVTRNTRGGKGEKQLSYEMFLEFYGAYPETAVALLPMFVLYGYWKDIFLIMEMVQKDRFDGKALVDACYLLIKEQWDKDIAALAMYKKALQDADGDKKTKLEKTGPAISLLAKWLPREDKSLDKKLHFVERFAGMVYGDLSTEAERMKGTGEGEDWKSPAKTRYRKQLAELASYLALPEVLLAAQRADEINIERVASKATKLLTNAFLNEKPGGEIRSDDPKRQRLREIFIDTILNKGLKGGQLMPHEIVSTILKGRVSRAQELALDAQWKSLWKGVVDQVKAKAAEEGIEFDPTRMVPLSDVSGSMSGTPMEVSIALGIGISEITHPAFKDMVLTFSSTPKWHRLNPTDTIAEKVRSLSRAHWGMDTNFVKAYDLILEVCRDHKLKREDMPCLIVFSDMQFNQADRTTSKTTMFQTIRSKTQETAKELGWEDGEPTPIVFWNLRNTGGHPVEKDTEGAVLLSGFSPSLLKMVMNGEALKEEEVEVVAKDGTIVKEKVRVTPEQVLKKMLDDSLYDPVRKILGESIEGALLGYEWIPEVKEEKMAEESEESKMVHEEVKEEKMDEDFEMM